MAADEGNVLRTGRGLPGPGLVTKPPDPASWDQMPEWLTLILVAAAYFSIMKWVLPRFGVPT